MGTRLKGAKASEIILEGFADKLADSIIKGGASIGDWDLQRGAKINVNISVIVYLILACVDMRSIM